MVKKHHIRGGAVDRRIVKSVEKNSRIIRCSKGHANGPGALFCWVCGEFLQDAQKPKQEIQHVPYERVDGTVTSDPVAEAARKEINAAIKLPEAPKPDSEKEEKLQKSAVLYCHQRKEAVDLFTCLNNCVDSQCMDSDAVTAKQKEINLALGMSLS